MIWLVAALAATLPPVSLDEATATYALRNGSFTTTIEAGNPVPARRGHFTLSGLGHDWVRPVTNAPFNVVNIHNAQVTSLKAVVPESFGSFRRVRVGRDGSGSIAVTGNGFLDSEGKPVPALDFPYAPRSRRTLGVDYSGKSGAAALLVFVDCYPGLGDRRMAWEADVGDAEVTIEKRAFTIRVPGQKATLRGTVVYPGTAFLEHRQGRIHVWHTKPEKEQDVQLEAHLEQKMQEISLAFQRKVEANIDEELRIALGISLEDKEHPEELARREREHLNYFAKLVKHTTSTSMGGPNRRPEARAGIIVVLTVQEGPAPEVRLVEFEKPELLWVGPQRVDYEEFLLQFGRTE